MSDGNNNNNNNNNRVPTKKMKKMLVKMIIVGDINCGKTAILHRYVSGRFSEAPKATIGADFRSKEIIVSNKRVTLQIWDTAGQERFQSLGTAFYRGSDACVLVYDITNENSFAEIENWRTRFVSGAGIDDSKAFPFLLLANKSDLVNERAVTKEQGQSYAAVHNMRFHETSALNGSNIDASMEEIALLLASDSESNTVVEHEQKAQSNRHSSIEFEPSIQKSEIRLSWDRYCVNENVINTDTDNDTGNDIKHNVSVKRILFILSHYQLWLANASSKTADNEINTETDANSITEVLQMCNNYTRSDIIDDFGAVKDLIAECMSATLDLSAAATNAITTDTEDGDEKNSNSNSNSSHENENNNKNQNHNTNIVRQFFKSCLGQCSSSSGCTSFVRNRRDRALDDNSKLRHASFYMREEVVQLHLNKQSTAAKYSRFEVAEVAVQSLLDIIHNYVLHLNDENSNMSDDHKSKFITNIETPTPTANANDNDESDVKQENEAENGKITNNSAAKPAVSATTASSFTSLNEYSFGESMSYWNKRAADYVPAKYADFKTELLNNRILALTDFQYASLEIQAETVLQSRYGQGLVCTATHDWMKVNGKQLIPKGSPITQNHLIAVLSYTNNTALQYEFKRQGFRKLSKNETTKDIRQRQTEIAHWCRLLFEVVRCFGTYMSEYTFEPREKYPLYHGINCKLLFSQFAVEFKMPTSLTTNATVANNFAKDSKGMILKVNACVLFDVSLISDYPNEDERLIFYSRTKFEDIWMNGTSYRYWVKTLLFWERIRKGYFLHGRLSTAKQQSCVCLIENYLQMKRNSELSAVVDESSSMTKTDDQYGGLYYVNGKIPAYVQVLFNRSCDLHPDWFAINEAEIRNYKLTNAQLLAYLLSPRENSLLLSRFETVRKSTILEFRMKGAVYDNFFAAHRPWYMHPEIYAIAVPRQNTELSALQIRVKVGIFNKQKNGFCCRLICDYLPTIISRIRLCYCLCIAATKSEKNVEVTFTHRSKSKAGMFGIVPSDLLKPENNSAMLEKKEIHVRLILYPIAVEYNN